ncbi:MAG TPA: glycosyltransferase family 2 protein [Chlamydiales bacterium]|nr:glycosyltransferase family 2 protein [Chlamydiales bacterium]
MISVAILTKNSQETLRKTLESTKGFSEVILLDTGSTDLTLEITEDFPNVKIYRSPFIGFGPLRNLATSYATHDWILVLDSDEILSPPLLEELKALSLNPKCVYSFPFHNFYKGKQVKCCGWHPESHIRLYNRKVTSFKDYEVHEGVKVDKLKVIHCKNPILHHPYRSIDDFLNKMQHYTSLFAKQNKHKKKSSFLTAFVHGSYAFFKSYLFQKGCFHGSIGFVIATYNASTAFYKYLKLAEENLK